MDDILTNLRFICEGLKFICETHVAGREDLTPGMRTWYKNLEDGRRKKLEKFRWIIHQREVLKRSRTEIGAELCVSRNRVTQLHAQACRAREKGKI